MSCLIHALNAIQLRDSLTYIHSGLDLFSGLVEDGVISNACALSTVSNQYWPC